MSRTSIKIDNSKKPLSNLWAGFSRLTDGLQSPGTGHCFMIDSETGEVVDIMVDSRGAEASLGLLNSRMVSRDVE